MIEINNFGKDHWSLLAYFETRCVDYKGCLNLKHMRVNSSKRGFGNGNGFKWEPTWGTRLKDNSIIEDHDDIDVMEELEEVGYIKNVGTLINPWIEMTDKGREVVNKIREHKSNNGSFKTFQL